MLGVCGQRKEWKSYLVTKSLFITSLVWSGTETVPLMVLYKSKLVLLTYHKRKQHDRSGSDRFHPVVSPVV